MGDVIEIQIFKVSHGQSLFNPLVSFLSFLMQNILIQYRFSISKLQFCLNLTKRSKPEHDTSAEFIILLVTADRRFTEDHVIMILIAEIKKNVLIFQVEGQGGL